MAADQLIHYTTTVMDTAILSGGIFYINSTLELDPLLSSSGD